MARLASYWRDRLGHPDGLPIRALATNTSCVDSQHVMNRIAKEIYICI